MISREELEKKVTQKRGKLIAYTSHWDGKSEFECAHNHRFFQRNKEIIYNDRWCKTCHFQKDKDENERSLREIVAKKGGICLFATYTGSLKKHDFQCGKGHKFSIQPNHIMNNELWCKFCSYQEKMETNFLNLKSFAEERGGALLSKEVTLVKHKYTFSCNMKHEFQLRGIDVLSGKWCPDCSKNIKERICRSIMENFFKKSFNSSTPEWLKSNKSDIHRLQLDGYSKELKVAFEYNGFQHYQFFEPFHKTPENFKLQQERDQLKTQLCKINGVTLVVIPEYKARNMEGIVDHVRNACLVAGITPLVLNDNIDFSKAYLNKDQERIQVLEPLLAKKKGKLICYIGGKCEVECLICLNRWHTSYSTLINDLSWCAKCSGNHKKDLSWLKKLAEDRGGSCLATKYKSSFTKVSWKCSNPNHPSWMATANAISSGNTWCPECNREAASEKAKKQWADGNLGRYPKNKKENNASS